MSDDLVTCDACTRFTLMPGSKELGRCDANAHEVSWAPSAAVHSGGYGLAPLVGVPRRCSSYNGLVQITEGNA